MKRTSPVLEREAHSKSTWVSLLFVLTLAFTPSCATEQTDESLDEEPPVSLEPDLRIDGYAADLVPVEWVGVSPRGTLALFQGQDATVRFFDPEGNLLGSVGRRGSGPGEFESLIRGGWVGDTLWVSDLQLSRITLISPDLEFVRVLPPLAGATPRAEDEGRLPTFHFVFP